MFIRKKPNKSGSISVQIISKSGGKYHVHKTISSGQSEQEVEKLYFLAKQQLERISAQPKLFISETDAVISLLIELRLFMIAGAKSYTLGTILYKVGTAHTTVSRVRKTLTFIALCLSMCMIKV